MTGPSKTARCVTERLCDYREQSAVVARHGSWSPRTQLNEVLLAGLTQIHRAHRGRAFRHRRWPPKQSGLARRTCRPKHFLSLPRGERSVSTHQRIAARIQRQRLSEQAPLRLLLDRSFVARGGSPERDGAEKSLTNLHSLAIDDSYSQELDTPTKPKSKTSPAGKRSASPQVTV